uniref:Iron-binding zinc finger CDGSH type domain-containing protein n=1 Tax=Anas zonorhyncha TaxID=75864 RepID=A0A8B9ZW18_9AVES
KETQCFCFGPLVWQWWERSPVREETRWGAGRQRAGARSGTPPPSASPPCPPQPFCDGSHRTAAPGVSPLRFTAEADGAAPLCVCKRTRTPPFCDGSHREQAAPPGPQP